MTHNPFSISATPFTCLRQRSGVAGAVGIMIPQEKDQCATDRRMKKAWSDDIVDPVLENLTQAIFI